MFHLRHRSWSKQRSTAALRLQCAVLSLFAVACSPKSAAPRRTVDVREQAPETTTATTVMRDYAWYTGARRFDDEGPKRTPSVAWEIDLGTPLVLPAVALADTVYLGGGGQVFAVDIQGQERWRSRVDSTGWVAPRESGVATATTAETVVDLDLTRGTIQDSLVAGGIVIGSPLPVGGELVWVTDTGKVVSETGWMVPASDSAIGAPASDGLHIYFGTKTGEVVAVNRARARWRTVLPGPIVGALVAADGLVFAAYNGVPGFPGGVAAIAADTGTVAWRMPLDDDPAAGPALGNLLYVPDRGGQIVAFDTATGDIIWRAPVAGAPSTTPALGRFGLYVGNADGRFHRFDPDDGGEVWSIDLGATPSAAPVLIDGKVIVGLADGRLVAIQGN